MSVSTALVGINLHVMSSRYLFFDLRYAIAAASLISIIFPLCELSRPEAAIDLLSDKFCHFLGKDP